MNPLQAVARALRRGAGLRLSQARARADLVGAAGHLGGAPRAAIGHKPLGPAAARRRIQPAWRFCANGGPGSHRRGRAKLGMIQSVAQLTVAAGKRYSFNYLAC